MARTHGVNTLQDRRDDDVPDWMDQFKEQQVKFESGRDMTIRPVSGFLVMGQHWPKIPKSGASAPPLWCPRFDSIDQKFVDNRPCPQHDDFGDKAQKRLLFWAIVREWQDGRKARDNPIGLVSLPGSLTKDILRAFKLNKHDIADPERGCDIMITYDKTEPVAAKKWSANRVETTQLSADEQALDIPVLEDYAPDFNNPEQAAEYGRAMRDKMARWSYYVKPLNNGKRGWDGYKWAVDGRPYTVFKELVGDKEDKGQGGGGGSQQADRGGREEGRRARPMDDGDGPRRQRPVDDPDPGQPAARTRERAPETDDPGEPTTSVAPAPAARTGGPRKYAEWTAEHGVQWTKNDDGTVQPSCLYRYADEPKCDQCVYRRACLDVGP